MLQSYKKEIAELAERTRTIIGEPRTDFKIAELFSALQAYDAAAEAYGSISDTAAVAAFERAADAQAEVSAASVPALAVLQVLVERFLLQQKQATSQPSEADRQLFAAVKAISSALNTLLAKIASDVTLEHAHIHHSHQELAVPANDLVSRTRPPIPPLYFGAFEEQIYIAPETDPHRGPDTGPISVFITPKK